MSQALLKQLRAEVGELIATHGDTRELSDFERYRGNPVAFFREELGFKPYAKQVEIAESFLEHRRVVVRGAHGTGKDATLAPLMLYAAYVEKMLVLAISATERQLLGQLWREVRKRFSPRLPGELFTSSLRLGGENRIIAMTSGSTSNLTGWHDPNGVFIAISEAQGEQVEAAAFDAAIANAVDDKSRIVVVGNPVRAAGRFYEVSNKPTWHAIAISAFDHPNVQQQEIVIPGGIAPGWPEEMAAEFGVDSPWYVSRVLGEFPPEGSLNGLIRASWLEPAYERWEQQSGMRPSLEDVPVVALDVARSLDRDSSVAAISQGARLHKLQAWRSRDLVDTADRAIRVAEDCWREWMGSMYAPNEFKILTTPPIRLHVDTPGVGGGVVDECRRREYPVSEYWGWRPSTQRDRFANLRAEVHWNVRKLLEDGRAQLPRDPMLREEMLAVDWSEDSKGRILIAPKEAIKAAIGRSPDRFDATTIVLHKTADVIEGRTWRLIPINFF